MPGRLHFHLSSCVAAFALLCSACLSNGGGDEGACTTGEEGCACYANRTCNEGLGCYSKLCVEDDDANDSESDGEGATGDGADGTDTEADPADSTDDAPREDTTDAVDDVDDTDEPTPDGDTTDPDELDPDRPTPPDPVGEDTPVGRHGQLRVNGTKIVDEHDRTVQLKGVSSMWLNWEPTGYAESLEGLRFMRDNWGLQIIRAAMGVDEDGAYLEDPDKAQRQVETIISNAIELGVYVLVDWHDHAAESHQAEAEAFFDNLSELYGDEPNLLYEVYNEPLDVDWSGVLVPYHERMVSAIRSNDPDNIVILGTPNWSQDVDIAASNPVSGSNLMYTLHFYACSHGAELRARAQNALAAGLPLFVTEWGASHADGGLDGIVCEADAAAWHDWMDDNTISWAAWKLDGCTDTTCFFKDRSVSTDGGWTSSDLNGHAPFVIERMQRENPGSVDPEPDPMEPDPNAGCTPSGSCADGNGMDCVEGDLMERDCSACSLLACGVSCCDSVGYFGATSQPAFVVNMDLITSFEGTSDSATLETAFDFSGTATEQVGVIAFKLNGSYEIDPTVLTVGASATGPVQVSLESSEGEAGCLYTTYDLGGYLILDGQVTCWGQFTTYSPVEQINARLVGTSSSAESMTITYLSW